LDIHFAGGPAFGLEKELVRVLVGKAHDLFLDRGAIAGAGIAEHARRNWRARQVLADDAVCFRVGAHQVTGHLGAPGRLMRDGIDGVDGPLHKGVGRAVKCKVQRRLTAKLRVGEGIVDGAGIHARRCVGDQSAQ